MALIGNIAISVKEEAFSDVAPKRKKVSKVVVGVGNGYSNQDKSYRFIKFYFGNNPKQTTKNLSYTKPMKTTDVKKIIETFDKVIKKDNLHLDKKSELDIQGMSIKDRKLIKDHLLLVQSKKSK